MNPRNPYPVEVAFDQHVWLPLAAETYYHLGEMIEDRKVIDSIIKAKLNVVPGKIVHPPRATIQILSKLSQDEISQVRESLNEKGMADNLHNIIRGASYWFPEMRSKMGTSIINPPDHIHRMQRGDNYIGDIYSADMAVTLLSENGLGFLSGEHYLDFGSSSGSLIRVLKAYAQKSTFHGVDPIASSIEWASENIPGAHFSVSNTMPSLNYEAQTFQGATAISIWSHLGEQEALAWFDEMHRILKPDGWLLFTTHGDTSISYYNNKDMYIPRRLLALLEGLVNSDFVFEEVYLGESPEGLSATGYGNAYIRRSWVDRKLSPKWDIVYHGEAENQGNQDVYILRKIS